LKDEPEPLWPLLTVVVVLAVATFAISMSVEWWGNTVLRSILVTALVLIVVANVQMIRYYRGQRTHDVPKSDERLDKIIIYASAYSFRAGILFIIVLIFANLLNVVTIDTVPALSASVFVMAGTYFAFHWYFDRKGDVMG
jgi:hypothetical protein